MECGKKHKSSSKCIRLMRHENRIKIKLMENTKKRKIHTTLTKWIIDRICYVVEICCYRLPCCQQKFNTSQRKQMILRLTALNINHICGYCCFVVIIIINSLMPYWTVSNTRTNKQNIFLNSIIICISVRMNVRWECVHIEYSVFVYKLHLCRLLHLR